MVKMSTYFQIAFFMLQNSNVCLAKEYALNTAWALNIE